jgi:hypothetical protein
MRKEDGNLWANTPIDGSVVAKMVKRWTDDGSFLPMGT